LKHKHEAAGMTSAQDGWYWSADGLRLHYLEWPNAANTPPDRPTLLCLPGLTRTARDFEALAARLAGHWRVIAVDLRGRGDSAWAKDSLTYVPLTYLLDLGRLIETAGITRFVVIGNSLGGQLGLQLTTGHRAAMAGIILNDCGPDLTEEGLARLRANVGRGGNWPTWVHAARDLAARNAGIYPSWQLPDWLAFARRLCRLSASGRIVFDYDPRIAEPFNLPRRDAPPLWAAFEALAGLPVLSLRGALSDIVSKAAQAEMQTRLPGLRCATISGVGHAPSLAEPEAVTAVDQLLAAVLAAQPGNGSTAA